MPWLYGFFLIVTLAGLSMPGTNGFVGEFTILLGAWQASYILVLFAVIGVVLAAWYMLRLHQGLMHDPPTPAAEKAADIGLSERLVLLPLVAIMLALGLYPRPVGEVARANVAQYVSTATTSTTPPQAAATGP
jgi:NADH-quinone oxidoreductase subunit M